MTVEGDKLIIRDTIDHFIITDHTLSQGKGELIKNNNHSRDTSTKLDTIHDRLLKLLNSSEEAGVFLTQIRRLKPRYARDQFALIEKTLSGQGQITVWKALNYCLTHSLFSAVEFKNAVEYFAIRLDVTANEALQTGNTIAFDSAVAVSKKRKLSEYALAAKGGDKQCPS